MYRLRSASSTPTSVTFGRFRPLATIWVPRRIGIFSFWKCSRIFSWVFTALTVSVSMRLTSMSGNRAFSSCCTFWVPVPMVFKGPPQLGHRSGAGWEKPQ